MAWSGNDADLGSGGGDKLREAVIKFLHAKRSRLRNLGEEPSTKPPGRLNFVMGPYQRSEMPSTKDVTRISYQQNLEAYPSFSC